jgi:hypothetical protein
MNNRTIDELAPANFKNWAEQKQAIQAFVSGAQEEARLTEKKEWVKWLENYIKLVNEEKGVDNEQ